MRDFTADEAKTFVGKFFPLTARDASRTADQTWIATRTSELLSGSFDSLLVRPVHAQMLCQIATDPALDLSNLSTYRLFDLFVHFLLDREVSKRGRDQRFTLDARRAFNRALALWLWEQGGASVPNDLCRKAVANIHHDYDEVALRKELTAGCLIEKGALGTI
jgi:hypothetical protein